ncbi:potassium voltage-gated channel subfamily A member 7-like [Mytilus trossulus]|uniref:potassium voltage-gated channel subfamily A member 7-like n=1 Tax=Mytilus trossulus TaxID=6551 RepID=UPI0030054AFA
MHVISQTQTHQPRGSIAVPGRDGYLSPDYHHHSPHSPHFLRKHRRNASCDSRRSELIPERSEPDTDHESVCLIEKPEFLETASLTDGHNCKQEECERIIINVSGLKFETQLRTLNRLPNTLLGDKFKREYYWDAKRKEFFFDRHRPSFPAILYFYQSGGRLLRPIEVPTDVFLTELQFFELGATVITAYKESEGFLIEDTGHEIMPKNPLQRKIWELFEYPTSSILAKIFALLSVIFIVVSVVNFCVETLPQYANMGCTNVTQIHPGNVTSRKEVPVFVQPLFIIEATCMSWFIIELIFRVISCPSKVLFIKNFVNWIDIVSIMPFVVSLAMLFITGECEGSSKTGAISVLRVLRVARILKLSKHSEGLQLLGKTLRDSVQELMMFVLFLGIGIVIFSGAIFYAELSQENTHFTSIPGSFWWAVVTMTTVGYGDMYPVGIFGKIIGTLAVLCGLLSIALPVPVIVTNFSNYYRASTGRGGF